MSGTCIGCGTQVDGGVLCPTCWAATTTSAPKTAEQVNAPQTGRTEFMPFKLHPFTCTIVDPETLKRIDALEQCVETLKKLAERLDVGCDCGRMTCPDAGLPVEHYCTSCYARFALQKCNDLLGRKETPK